MNAYGGSLRAAVLVFSVDLLVIAFSIAVGLHFYGVPDWAFGEGRIASVFSIFQIAAIAAIVWQIRRVRQHDVAGQGWYHPARLWTVIAFGFAYLALDEGLQLHERVHGLYALFGWKESNLTNRVSDFVLIVYAFAGVAILFMMRSELRLCRFSVGWFLAGAAILSLMMALDARQNRRDFVILLGVEDPSVDAAIKNWLNVGEESTKLLAEGAFLLVFWTAYRQILARRSVR